MIPFHIAKPQGCDIQTFVGTGSAGGTRSQYRWNKPVGVSHVYMMLIGGGGDRDPTDAGAGASGGVTVWYGAAQHVPDNLLLSVSAGYGRNTVIYYQKITASLILLEAKSPGGSSGRTAPATAANAFAASGFYQSIAGQGVVGSNPVSASPTTFLSSGAGGNTMQTVTANYGYSQSSGYGSFRMQPIIVGVGNNALAGVDSVAAIGCGGSSASGLTPGYGGPGMILIASW